MANAAQWSNLNPSSQIQSLGAGGLYGSYSQGGGGIPVARDQLDSMRLGIGRVPSAEYPDGYLGQIRSRRDDRLLDSLKTRLNQKSYQRGVHKGERIDPGDYVWSAEFNPQTGIQLQKRGRKFAPIAVNTNPPHLVNDGKADTPNHIPGQINPVRVAQMASLRPAWR